jgi:NAD(P)-dependent dehydrogenase (short-subunit alcohol dehydrogenase family)
MSLLHAIVVAACYTEEGAKFPDRIVTKTVVADLGTSDGVEAVVDAWRDELNQNYKKLWAIVNNAGVCFLTLIGKVLIFIIHLWMLIFMHLLKSNCYKS